MMDNKLIFERLKSIFNFKIVLIFFGNNKRAESIPLINTQKEEVVVDVKEYTPNIEYLFEEQYLEQDSNNSSIYRYIAEMHIKALDDNVSHIPLYLTWEGVDGFLIKDHMSVYDVTSTQDCSDENKCKISENKDTGYLTIEFDSLNRGGKIKLLVDVTGLSAGPNFKPHLIFNTNRKENYKRVRQTISLNKSQKFKLITTKKSYSKHNLFTHKLEYKRKSFTWDVGRTYDEEGDLDVVNNIYTISIA